MTQEILAGISGVVISLLFFYVPGLKTWYAAKTAEAKRLVMLLVLALTAAGVAALACSGYGVQFGLMLSCNADGWVVLLRAFIAVVIANQTTFLIAPVKRN